MPIKHLSAYIKAAKEKKKKDPDANDDGMDDIVEEVLEEDKKASEKLRDDREKDVEKKKKNVEKDLTDDKPTPQNKPVKPDKPVKPKEAVKPVKPKKPVKPVKHEHEEKFPKPAQPIKPPKPAKPAEPIKPIKPFKEGSAVKAIDPHLTEICRGINLSLDIKRKDLGLCEKIREGKLTVKELLSFLGNKPVGEFWYLIGNEDAGIEDSEEFAVKEDDLSVPSVQRDYKAFKDNEGGLYDDTDEFYVELPMVLVAERPKDWHPDNNPDSGLMGNSYLDTKKWKAVKLKNIRYLDGNRKWVVMPCNQVVKI